MGRRAWARSLVVGHLLRMGKVQCLEGLQETKERMPVGISFRIGFFYGVKYSHLHENIIISLLFFMF